MVSLLVGVGNFYYLICYDVFVGYKGIVWVINCIGV